MAITVISAVFLFLNISGFLAPVKNFFYSMSASFQKQLWAKGIDFSGFVSGIAESQNIKKELEEMRQKNQEISAQNAALLALKKENEILRQALNLGMEKEFQLKLAEIFSKDIMEDSILISIGEKDGVKKGMPVISKEKTLAGRIGEVYANYSEVILITSSRSSFDGQVLDEDVLGVVKGKGGSSLVMERIPKEKEVSVRDAIVTTALGNIFPKGLLVGEVEEVKKTDLEPYQSARIKPAFQFNNSESLFIITNF